MSTCKFALHHFGNAKISLAAVTVFDEQLNSFRRVN